MASSSVTSIIIEAVAAFSSATTACSFAASNYTWRLYNHPSRQSDVKVDLASCTSRSVMYFPIFANVSSWPYTRMSRSTMVFGL